MRLIERMPSLYRQRLQLPLSEIISKSMHRRWSISCIKTVLQISADKESASASELAPSETNFLPLPRALELVPAGLSACGGAAAPPGGICHASMPNLAEAASPTACNGDRRRCPCRCWGWRHALAGIGSGGRRHVSPAQTCRH
jgi:hypothetical protein